MAYYCVQPYQEHQLLHIAENIILQTGVMGLQYSEWRSEPAADCTFENLISFMNNKYNLWLETGNTAAQHGYGGKAEGSTGGEDVDQTYSESLSSFSNVNEQNANTFQNLLAANEQLINVIVPSLQNLQNQM